MVLHKQKLVVPLLQDLTFAKTRDQENEFVAMNKAFMPSCTISPDV